MTYGCHNLPRPQAGATLKGSPFYGSQEWPFVNSTNCQYDLSHKDAKCQECKWAQEAHRGVTLSELYASLKAMAAK